MRIPLLRAPRRARAEISRLTAASGAPSARDREIAARIVAERIGGAFWEDAPALPSCAFSAVILPDSYPAAGRLWRQVLPNAPAGVLLLVFPRLTGRFRGFARAARKAGFAVVKAGDPHKLVEAASAIYVAEPEDHAVLGLLAGRAVFRAAGGALTQMAADEAIVQITQGTRYFNPFTGAAASCEEIIDLLAEWRRFFEQNRQVAVCAGMSLWTRRRMAQFFSGGAAAPVFRHTAGGAIAAAEAAGGAIAVWATRVPAGLETMAAARRIPLIRVEDGFIRSAGLGSNLAPPASIVTDRRGIYLDPARPSELEELLAATEFSEELRGRARGLMALLKARGISKYGSGGARPVMSARPGQRIILVPGQVADDLSVRLGGAGMSNLQLLEKTRAANPEAFIFYRPHPDVTAGHRRGAIADPVAAGLADQCDSSGAMAALLGAVDEVHTITSLAGFEGLIRGLTVVTHGQPFYAGWGLTHDFAPVARRARSLSVEELVAAALILYPRYLDPATGLPCGPETLCARLFEQRHWRPSPLSRLRQAQGRLRLLVQGAQISE